MPVHTTSLELATRGNSEITDITQEVAEELANSPIQTGLLTVFVPGSTGGVITLECEPGLVRDLEEAFERWAPSSKTYHHDRAWADGNGHSHVRASLVGPSLSVPFKDRCMTLGTWQQLAFVDFDTRPRKRVLILQLVGE
ncbi:MAG: secondary thiamine-phosphate synthase enzyme [Candidatus Solincola sediminis]|uniref:Secondary thiamine-phosphate synthase enzyme n=1 Tax=Candidatus Solincola sediminis TaxID=1797199 RepID=A0A1F2WTK9_9ACTN|nr:MAG: secondary thiamine-phosphate synthase enzyme [Candidatus Solincola sediminis]OFW60866.1 MAG: secondary thiamine-phosphate synthase enzyme [Candidatus Solincola sediminis]